MKKFIPFAMLFFACIMQTSAQQNCSSPLDVTLCPATSLTGQTNLGMLNDYTSSCNLTGEDLVYRFTTRPGTSQVYVSFTSVSTSLRATLTTNCAFTGCSYVNVWAGNTNRTFTVIGNTTYYLWIDAFGTVTYNIAFGNDTTSTFINIPNTQGNLDFENSLCATPPFMPAKPELQAKFNGVFQTDPMTLAPLGVPGTFCVINYFRNTTGIEGIRKFEFYYNPLGFSNFTPSPMSFPGFYNAGTWTATWSINKWVFTFTDLAGTGKGDFTGIPNTCIRYEFCFDVTPISNDPILTNIKDSAFSDGFGLGFTGTVRSGCCPPGFSNCLGASGGGAASGGAHAFGTGLADPGGLLPIVLLQFSAKPKNENVEVYWTTASELNNEFFTVQKSRDGIEWIAAHEIPGAGNSTSSINYSYTDTKPFPGTSYYRLRQTDFDGTTSYSETAVVSMKKSAPLIVYPNPTQGDVIISGMNLSTDMDIGQHMKFILSNTMGKAVTIPYSQIDGEVHIDISAFADGIYLLEMEQDGVRSHQRIILQN